ncbi:hypothetical protein CTAYLR_010529 [Chrysophaeum taylorii]|uniref:Sulfotransferase n=1 Tax=Chrysophaeum taylorii TaxID=2483200 RepID=A0AAD7UJI5_9STRA|nr:hypothetical protein CTAYLR_010529 [Chrysophaeum taylorii]
MRGRHQPWSRERRVVSPTRRQPQSPSSRRLVAGIACLAGLSVSAVVWFRPSPQGGGGAPCPHSRVETKRVGVRDINGRSVFEGVPCEEAVVDAGLCFRNEELYCLPSFIIGGAQKAATGWLRQWLATHPELSQGGEHEVHYFDKLEDSRASDWSSRYLPFFRTASTRHYSFEKTPDYLPNATALAAIRGLLPSVKLVFLLRAPAARAYSAFQHHCRRLRIGAIPASRRSARLRAATTHEAVVFSLEATRAQWARCETLRPPCSPEAFESFLATYDNASTRIVDWGLYALHLANVRSIFPDDQIFVAIGEVALARASAFFEDVVAWLGIRRFDFATLPTYRDALGRQQLRQPGIFGFFDMWYMRLNVAMVHKHAARPMLARTKTRLGAFYKPHNLKLDALLLYQAPAISVFPPRSTIDDGRKRSLLPPSWGGGTTPSS